MVMSNKRQSPPLFADLDVDARRVFGHVQHQFDQLNSKSFARCGSTNKDSLCMLISADTDSFIGSLATRQTTRIGDYSFTTIKSCNTNHGITTALSLHNRIASGTKLAVDLQASQSGCWASAITGEYRNAMCSVNGLAGAGFGRLAVVTGRGSWLAGCQLQLGLDSKKPRAVTLDRLVLGYVARGYAINTHLVSPAGGDKLGAGGSAYLRVCPWLEVAADAHWSLKTQEGSLAIGCACDLGAGASLRASLDDTGTMGLEYKKDIGGGKLVTVSALIDASNMYYGHHKLVFGLEVHE